MSLHRLDAATRAAPAASRTPLVLDGVSRAFGGNVALAPLSLRQEAGTVCLVTGSNGSGKSTLLRLAAGIWSPTTGTRRAEEPCLYLRAGDGARRNQTARQAASLVASLRGHAGGGVEEALEAAGLSGIGDTAQNALSAGQRARVTLAVALVSRPALLCLDEPTVHLDEAGALAAALVITRLAAEGTAVLVATHDRRWLDPFADARLHLAGGRLAAPDGESEGVGTR